MIVSAPWPVEPGPPDSAQVAKRRPSWSSIHFILSMFVTPLSICCSAFRLVAIPERNDATAPWTARKQDQETSFCRGQGGRIVVAKRGTATITSLPHFESSFREKASRGDLNQTKGWLGVGSMTHFHGRVLGLVGPPGGSFSIPSFMVPFVLRGPSLRAIVLTCKHPLVRAPFRIYSLLVSCTIKSPVWACQVENRGLAMILWLSRGRYPSTAQYQFRRG